MKRFEQEQLVEERLVFDLFNSTFPYGLVLIDRELTVCWASEGCARILRYRLDRFVGAPLVDLVHPDDLAEVFPVVMALAEQRGLDINPAGAAAAELPIRVRSESGDWIPVNILGRVIDEDGRILCVLRESGERHALDDVILSLGHGADLSETLRAVVALVAAQFRVLDACIVHDFRGDPMTVGSAPQSGIEGVVELLAGWRDGRPHGICHDDDHWVIPIVSAEGQTRGAIVLAAPREGGPSPYDVYVLERTTGLAAVAFARAESDLVLEQSASSDHLTGVLNRRAFEERLHRLTRSDASLPLAAMFLDLDGFKGINDRWGHAIGDQVLATVAQRITHATRSTDIVARLGGDEFIVICQGLSSDEVVTARNRLRSSISQPIVLDSVVLVTSASIGVATATKPGEASTLLRRSDENMYVEKRASREAARPDPEPLRFENISISH